MDTLEIETRKQKQSEEKMNQPVKTRLTPKDWEDNLHALCLNREDRRLVINLLRLLRMGESERSPMQLLVIRNLVSKLQRANNHHYADLVKDISGLFKHELGPNNYHLLTDLFGLAKETTAVQHSSHIRIDPGLDMVVLDAAAKISKGLPVNEGSDGARCLHFLKPTKQRGRLSWASQESRCQYMASLH